MRKTAISGDKITVTNVVEIKIPHQDEPPLTAEQIEILEKAEVDYLISGNSTDKTSFWPFWLWC